MGTGRRRGALVALAMVAALGQGTGAAATAQPPQVQREPAAATWVTLITGDRVLMPGQVVEPVRRERPARFSRVTIDGDHYVIPGDAARLIQAGVLDRELFNVSELVRLGYDDARSASLPLLVEHTGAVGAGVAMAGTAVRRVLPAVGMTALDADKSTVEDLWASLRRPVVRAGVEKVWLNGRVRATLDESVPQVGAPAAWAAGLTGSGIDVAVLDTGIDTDHPDLAGRIGATRDFSGLGTVEDGNGHGTHVASTIAGSGAASGGAYRGVAPDATLAVGKVLDDFGNGTFDAVLAGMEWAAVEADADVVNMSLGGGISDGTDPVSQAVNTLTRDHGALFVIAAGNYGGDRTVSTPAAADAALAVGSVSKQDVPSPFSSRGPRSGDGALKPEIAAPGEGIAAARPAGVPPLGEPVGEAYQRLDGTSMAAPHVAGAAAILAQQHPDWSPARLKDALTSTAAPVDGARPYDVGSGRLDVARATGQPVTATGSASAYLPWPTDGATAERTLTWHNHGDQPVTLDLELALTGADGQPAPDGLVTPSARQVTVPADGTAEVELVIAAQAGRPGEYSGVLVATGGSSVTRTALSIYQEDEHHDLDVTVLDREGRPAQADGSPLLTIQSLDRVQEGYWAEPGRIRLPRGRYMVLGMIPTARPGQEPTLSRVVHPELVLDGPASVTLDARQAHPVSAEPANRRAGGGSHNLEMLVQVTDCACTFSFGLTVDPMFHEVYAATVPGTSSPGFAFAQSRRAVEPRLELATRDFGVAAGWLRNSPEPAESARLRVVYGGAGTEEDLAGIDARGALVLIEVPGEITYEEVFRRTGLIRDAGARLAMVNVLEDYGPAAGAAATTEPSAPALPTLRGYGPTARRLAEAAKAGQATVDYVSRPTSTLRYELAYGVEHRITGPQVHVARDRDLAAVRVAYHDNAPDPRRYVVGFTEFFGRPVGGGFTEAVAAASEPIEYFTPGRWELMSSGYAGPWDSLSDTVELTTGRPARMVISKAVAGPTFRGSTFTRLGEPRPWAMRDAGAIDVILPMFGDSEGRPRVPFAIDDIGDTGSIALHRDGEPVGVAPVPDQARFDVPGEAATYRLTAEVRRGGEVIDPYWTLWRSVSAEWTFRSSAADAGQPLPLLSARVDPDVDLRNRARGGGRFELPIRVERQDVQGPLPVREVSQVAVEVSYDDGVTWRPARVEPTGDHWTAHVRHPRGGGHASLRVAVTDTDGNTLRQTVVRAYELRR